MFSFLLTSGSFSISTLSSYLIHKSPIVGKLGGSRPALRRALYMLETSEEAKWCSSECTFYGDDWIWNGLYAHEDSSVKEGKRCQVNIQRKYHLFRYSLSVGWGYPTYRISFVGTQQEMQKVFTGWSLCESVILMTKCGILRGESLFRCELSDFWDFMRTDEEPHPLHCVVM